MVEALLVLAGDPEAIDGWRGGQAGAGVDGDGAERALRDEAPTVVWAAGDSGGGGEGS